MARVISFPGVDQYAERITSHSIPQLKSNLANFEATRSNAVIWNALGDTTRNTLEQQAEAIRKELDGREIRS